MSMADDSGCGPIIVIQQAAQTLTSLDRACVDEVVCWRLNESVAQPLVVAFAMVQLSNTTPILGISARFAIPGIHGMAGQCGCMPAS